MTNDETKQTRDEHPGLRRLRFVIRDLVIRCLPIGVPAISLAFICYIVAGNSFDLFLGGVFVAVFLLPPCSAIAGRLPGVWIVVSLGIGMVWLEPVRAGLVSGWQWMGCAAVLVSFAGALSSAVSVAVCWGLPGVVASGLVTFAALAWLIWPVWLSPSIGGSHPYWLVVLHPLFAINHLVSQLGIWTEQQGAYQLTTLGQDVPYQLPTSAWPVIGFQSGLGIVMAWAATWHRARSELDASPGGR